MIAAFTFVPFFVVAYFYQSLSAQVPLFLNLSGDVEVWAEKGILSVFRVPLLALITQVVLLIIKYGSVQSKPVAPLELATGQTKLHEQYLRLSIGLWDWFRWAVAFKMIAESLDTVFLSIDRFKYLAQPAFIVSAPVMQTELSKAEMQTVPTQEVQTAAPLVSSGPKDSFVRRLCVVLFKPVDISFLVFFRVVFGGIMLWESYRYFTHGWIARYYVEPALTFTYYGFSWVKPWPGRGMYIHFAVLGLAAACVMAGFLYRIAAPVFFLAFTYLFLLDQTRYLNHFYLVCLISFLMCFLSAERAFSVDALLRPKIRSDVVPAWTLWLLRAQVGIPFFYGGIAKLNSDWIHGGEPMRSWLRPLTRVSGGSPIFTSDWVVYGFVFGGLLLDLLVVPLLLWRRTRIFAFVAAVLFNLINAVIFDIGIFPWLMLGALFVFFPPELMRRFARRFMSPGEEFHETEPSQVSIGESFLPLSTSQKIVVGVLAIYLGFHLMFPLRHYLYPGNVSWTEEGHNFSWHMKLRTKSGEAVFTMIHPPSGQTWTIKPEDYLESHQLIKVITKPDLILLFAHHLAEEKRREGYENVEVRARVMASLNGRQPQLLIDPEVDLAKEEVSLLPTRWIVPLTTPLGSGNFHKVGEDTDEP